ncbi:glutathione S-transferase [Aspergillus campestris IBT 28561]|uniref:Glutathione S-transferase n=1 Tax=Aspergillus campestris (strain IBT 28561) TaxID=1392248 RepID=A0A2I1DFN1_ASPC2|nr:glutathione S-transferase [Aspergillus campestris IBT 28561]PKY08685.1 glutathione S-transferase [Aspergillus campestris IBT 28561]
MNVFNEQRGQIALYATPGSKDAATVAIVLEELRLPHSLHLISSPSEIQDPNIPASPTLPLITNISRHGTHHVFSGFAEITTYLLSSHDQHKHISYAQGSKEAEEVVRWISVLSTTVADNHNHHDGKNKGPEGDEEVPFARKALGLYLRLEQQLSTARTRFLVGSKCTLADLAAFPYVAAAGSVGLDLERFPELTSWFDRVAALGSVAKGMAAVKLSV